MIFKVLKPIPGTGYSIGGLAGFEGERAKELLDNGYIEPVKSTPQVATIKPSENAAINPPKQKKK